MMSVIYDLQESLKKLVLHWKFDQLILAIVTIGVHGKRRYFRHIIFRPV